MKKIIFLTLFIVLCIASSLKAYAKDPVTISVYGGAKIMWPTQLGKWAVASEPYFLTRSHKEDFAVFGIDFGFPLNKELGIVSGLSISAYNSSYKIGLYTNDILLTQNFLSSFYSCQFPLLLSVKVSKRWAMMVGPTINYLTSNKDEMLGLEYYSEDSVQYNSSYSSKYKNKIASSLQFRLSYAPSKWSALTFIANYDVVTAQNIEFNGTLGNVYSNQKNYNYAVNQKFFSAALIYQLYIKGSVFKSRKKKDNDASELSEGPVDNSSNTAPAP